MNLHIFIFSDFIADFCVPICNETGRLSWILMGKPEFVHKRGLKVLKNESSKNGFYEKDVIIQFSNLKRSQMKDTIFLLYFLLYGQFSNLKRSQMKDTNFFYYIYFLLYGLFHKNNIQSKIQDIANFCSNDFWKCALIFEKSSPSFQIQCIRKISTCLWWPWNVEFSHLQFETNSSSEISITANFPREINHRFRWRYI